METQARRKKHTSSSGNFGFTETLETDDDGDGRGFTGKDELDLVASFLACRIAIRRVFKSKKAAVWECCRSDPIGAGPDAYIDDWALVGAIGSNYLQSFPMKVTSIIVSSALLLTITAPAALVLGDGMGVMRGIGGDNVTIAPLTASNPLLRGYAWCMTLATFFLTYAVMMGTVHMVQIQRTYTGMDFLCFCMQFNPNIDESGNIPLMAGSTLLYAGVCISGFINLDMAVDQFGPMIVASLMFFLFFYKFMSSKGPQGTRSSVQAERIKHFSEKYLDQSATKQLKPEYDTQLLQRRVEFFVATGVLPQVQW